jgi:C4-type Zn-finger protein
MNSPQNLESTKLGSSTCPVCGSDIDIYLHIYRAPLNESIAILTIKCEKCGFKSSSILTINASMMYNCIKLKIELPEDLNTLLYIGENVDIEVPDMDIYVSSSQLSIGNIVTADAIMLYIIDSLKELCISNPADNRCKRLHDMGHQITLGKIEDKVEIILKSSGGIGILKRYRDGNYDLC